MPPQSREQLNDPGEGREGGDDVESETPREGTEGVERQLNEAGGEGSEDLW